MASPSPLMFSGNAANLLKSVGAAVPGTKPQTSLEESQAAKASQLAEECHDPDCGHDHSHDLHGHAHGHAAHGHAARASCRCEPEANSPTPFCGRC